MSDPLNPYASPQAPAPIVTDASAGAVRHAPLYASAGGKAKVTVAANATTLLLQILLIVSFALQLSLLYGAKDGVQFDDAAGRANDIRHQIIAGFTIVATLVSLVMLLIWIYAAHSNLGALGATQLQFSPGWAVGWFFIPIANLVKPYQAVVELWQNSDPAPLKGQAAADVALIGWWWGLRIVSAIAGRVLGRIGGNESTIDDFIAMSWAALSLTLLVDVPLRITEIRLIRTAQRFQDERYALLAKPADIPGPTSLTAPFVAFRDPPST